MAKYKRGINNGGQYGSKLCRGSCGKWLVGKSWCANCAKQFKSKDKK